MHLFTFAVVNVQISFVIRYSIYTYTTSEFCAKNKPIFCFGGGVCVREQICLELKTIKKWAVQSSKGDHSTDACHIHAMDLFWFSHRLTDV